MSFTLQKFWTFNDHSREGMSGQLVQYFSLQLFGLAANLIGIYILVETFGLWYMFSQVLLIILVAIVVFFVSKFVIFSRSRDVVHA